MNIHESVIKENATQLREQLERSEAMCLDLAAELDGRRAECKSMLERLKDQAVELTEWRRAGTRGRVDVLEKQLRAALDELALVRSALRRALDRERALLDNNRTLDARADELAGVRAELTDVRIWLKRALDENREQDARVSEQALTIVKLTDLINKAREVLA